MVFNFERGAADCGKRGEAAGAFASLKKRPTEFCASAGLSLLMRGLDYFFSVALPPQWTVEIDQEPIEFVRSGLFTRFELSGYPHPPTPLAARLVKKRPPPPETAS